jgi:NADPH:quinone reductase-like Zn-dependent oxidoreductase
VLSRTAARGRIGAEPPAAVKCRWRCRQPLFRWGEVKPVVDSVFPFARIREATAKMERNENVGKIVVVF